MLQSALDLITGRVFDSSRPARAREDPPHTDPHTAEGRTSRQVRDGTPSKQSNQVAQPSTSAAGRSRALEASWAEDADDGLWLRTDGVFEVRNGVWNRRFKVESEQPLAPPPVAAAASARKDEASHFAPSEDGSDLLI